MTIKKDAIEEQIQECSKQITYFITEYTVGYLASEMANDNYYIPEYQRPFVWEQWRRSRFIESLIMGLPIPFLFYYENTTDGRLEIVDGSQRLRTIQEFISGKLRLGRLQRLTALNGLTFFDLDESRQRKICNRSIRGIVLGEGTDEEARLDLFNRINTGSKHATPAEIRKGSLKGPFLDMIQELLQDDVFISMIPLSVEKKRQGGEHEELLTRFFAYGDGLNDYRRHVDEFLYQYVKRMNDVMRKKPKTVTEYRKRLSRTLEFIKAKFPYGFFKTPKGRRVTKTRFEAIAVGTWKAIKDKGETNLTTDFSWIDSDDFRKILRSDAANNIKNLTGRINYVYNHLIGE